MSLGEGSLALQLKVLESGVCMCVEVVSITQRSKNVILSQDSLLQKGPPEVGKPVGIFSHTVKT